MAEIGDLGAELNLLCRQGHTIGPFEMDWKYEDGTPVDITSATFTSAIRASQDATTDLDSFDITTTSGPLGTFEIVLPAAQSAALPISDKLFYLVSATIAGVKTPLFYGKIGMRPG